MNYIWIIVIVVVVMMAIIGYIAENSKKGKNEKPKKETPNENISKTEAKQGAENWSTKSKPKDEKQEIEHKVPTIDDWSKIPAVDNKSPESKPEAPKENNPAKEKEDVMFKELNENQSDIKEVAPEPMPAENNNIEPTVMPATEPVPVPTPASPTNNIETEKNEIKDNTSEKLPSAQTNQPDNNLNNNSVIQTPIPEQITEPVSTENIWS